MKTFLVVAVMLVVGATYAEPAQDAASMLNQINAAQSHLTSSNPQVQKLSPVVPFAETSAYGRVGGGVGPCTPVQGAASTAGAGLSSLGSLGGGIGY